MSYTIEQKVKNHIYLYQVESYWDKEKKQSRQKRIYLGKKDPLTGEVVKEENIYAAWDNGHTYFLQAIAKKIGLTAELKKAFPEKWNELLTLALFKTIEGKPFYLCKDWLDTVELEEKPELSSQHISVLLRNLSGEKDSIFQFFTTWAKRQKDANRFIVFDITSVSSYSKGIDFAEWGYNRDKESLSQINLGVIFGRPVDLPLFYSLYPGSIHDVSTLTNIITELGVLSLDSTTFVLDKGFYSAANLSRMFGIKHIIPLPVRTNKEKELVEKYQGRLRSSEYAFNYNQHVEYCAKDKISIANTNYHAYVYLNEKKQVEQREKFLKSIIECEQYLIDAGYRKKKDFDDFFKERKPDLIQYFVLQKTGSQYIILRDNTAIDKTLARMGIFVLLTNTELDGEEVLHLYREKDGVEKCFDSLKNNLSLKRLRIHSQEALEGLLFIEFIALILYSYLSKVLRETGMNKTLSIPEVLFELRKIKKIQFGRKKTIISEISKRQREIFKAFDISPLS